MRTDLVLVAILGIVGYAHACGQTGWGEWIDDNRPSAKLFPEEVREHITSGGGDVENITIAARDTFCAPGHGTITKIQCVSENGNHNFTANNSTDPHTLPQGITCGVHTGFKCQNRIFNKTGLCEDFKIRLYCTCSDPVPTTAAPVTARPSGSGAPTGTGTGGAGSGGGNTGSGSGTRNTGGNNGGGNTAAGVVVCKFSLLLMLFIPTFLL